jgi:subtilisin-like proprotein convertase family protein
MVTSTLSFTPTDGIADIDVYLTLTHTWDSQLVISLTAPFSRSVLLVDRRGGDGHDFSSTTFDDGALTSIVSGTAPFTGHYRPEQTLSRFNGYSPQGVWTLSINDAASGEPGVLLSWGMTVTLSSGVVHTYYWDVAQSGFFGQSDNVVFRIEAAPAIVNKPNTTPGPYLYGRHASTTFPFRVRGTQARVVSGTVGDVTPMSNAVVYRLPAGQAAGGQIYADLLGNPFRTDTQGYLQGQGEIGVGDQLLALAPITAAESYTLYYTNGALAATGLDAHTVTQPGVQVLTVSAEHPLLLFNLHVSLEWDAHNDPTYLNQLAFDLQKASQYLYDFTDGQVALGHVTVHQNGDYWIPAHVVVRSTNRMRPFAIQGGIVLTATVDPEHEDIVYDAGQVHMGATWNRYGAPGYSFSGDWPLALAHELSHYLLFQEDVYLGLNDEGVLIPVDTCIGSAMGDMYDPNNTEFIYDPVFWQANCSETLANQSLGRTEWETNRIWYPELVTPTFTHAGPTLMSFDFTSVAVLDPLTPTNALEDPTFYLDYASGEVASSEARGFILRDETDEVSGYDYAVDLGGPLGGQNRLLARGAQPGDRLCVFDRARSQYGCEVIVSGDDRLGLERDATWTPLVQVSPVASQTIHVEVDNLPPSLALQARLYPEYSYGSEAITLTYDGMIYQGTFELPYPALAGYVQVWVDEAATETDPRRETIVSYVVGGNPGLDDGAWPASRFLWPASRFLWPASRFLWPASRFLWPFSRGGFAPLVSPDGQMIFFTENPISFEEGELYTVQSVAGLPPLPDGKVAIGQGYGLVVSPNVTRTIGGSISFQKLSMDVLVEGVDEETLTIHFWDGSGWRALDTMRSAYYNLASAPSQGSGTYALLAGVTTPHVTSVTPSAATNDVTTTLTINGGYFLPPVDVVLMESTAIYTLPVTSVTPSAVTAVVTRGLPARQYQVFVVNHNEPGGSAVTPDPGTLALYDQVPACFYDFFESGVDKWEVGGDWAIVILPSGERAITDSPAGNYDSAPASAITRTTYITSAAFDLTGCSNPVLAFRHDYIIAQVGTSRDVGRVEISTDGGVTWISLSSYSGGGIYGDQDWTQSGETEWSNVEWEDIVIDLSPYTGTVRLRFGLEVDQYVSDKGWVIDNVMVRSQEGVWPVFLPWVIRE